MLVKNDCRYFINNPDELKKHPVNIVELKDEIFNNSKDQLDLPELNLNKKEAIQNEGLFSVSIDYPQPVVDHSLAVKEVKYLFEKAKSL